MKNIWFLFLLLVVGIGEINAQKIENDSYTNDARFIVTSLEAARSFTDKVFISFGMEFFQPEGTEGDYLVAIKLVGSSDLQIPQGGRMLLKTNNGDVVQLEALNKGISGQETNMGYTSFYVNASYPVTIDQLNELFPGITKVRVELESAEPFEKEFSKDKIGKVLKKDYELIQGALSKNPKGNFNDGF